MISPVTKTKSSLILSNECISRKASPTLKATHSIVKTLTLICVEVHFEFLKFLINF